MILSMVLALAVSQTPEARFDHPPVPLTKPCSLARVGELCIENRTHSEERDHQLVKGLMVDTFRVAGGALFDLWATEYCEDHNPQCYETNPGGVGRDARNALKAATALGIIAVLHKLRADGHPTWAKWLGRSVMVVQFALGVHAIRLGNQEAK